MAFAKMTLDTPSGAQLAVYAQEAIGTAKAIIHVNHGLAEHALRYQGVADMLCELGYHVIAQDHRGHGTTEVDGLPPRLFADTNGWDRVIEDVGAVNARIKKLNPGLPIVLVGHSMGGLIALEYLLRQPGSVEAASIWGAPVYKDKALYLARVLLALEGKVRGHHRTSPLFNRLAFGSYGKKIDTPRTAFDWLSRDADAVDAYIADPRCGWPPSNGMARDLIRGSIATFDDKRLNVLPKDLPILLMGGDMDPVTRYGAALSQLHRRLAAAGLSRVDIARFQGMRHEIHHEEGNSLPLQKFVDWLNTTPVKSA